MPEKTSTKSHKDYDPDQVRGIIWPPKCETQKRNTTRSMKAHT
jgi:hypothetical protein